MTSKGEAAYCGIPTTQRTSSSTACARKGGECKSEDTETFHDTFDNDHNTFCRSFGKKSAVNCDTIGTSVVNVCCVPSNVPDTMEGRIEY